MWGKNKRVNYSNYTEFVDLGLLQIIYMYPVSLQVCD